jgi:hypothetical protein
MSLTMMCPRHYTLRTTSGHVLKFEPNVPVSVPDECVDAALAVNILPVERDSGDDEPASTEGKAIAQLNVAGPLRDAVAYRVIGDLHRENSAADFDGGGRPKASSINARSGLQLTTADVQKYWTQYRQIKSNGEEMPTHKALEQLIEIQALHTSKDMREYAADLGVPEKALTGRSLREQKNILLSAAIKAR